MAEDRKPSKSVEPDPPESAPKYIVEGLGKQDVETLYELSTYAEDLAQWRTVQAVDELKEEAADVDGTPDEWDEKEWNAAIDEAYQKADLPSGKGTLTVKTIDDRGYYYLQWREGSKIKSQYVAPVTPAGPS